MTDQSQSHSSIGDGRDSTSSGARSQRSPQDSPPELSQHAAPVEATLLRWNELQEVLAKSDLTPDQLSRMAQDQLSIALQLFTSADPRLAKAHFIMAGSLEIESAETARAAYNHLLSAVRVYERQKPYQFHMEHLLAEVRITALLQPELQSNQACNMAARAARGIVSLLPAYITSHQSSESSVFQALSLCADISVFWNQHHPEPVQQISRLVRTMCRLAGMPKPQNIELITESPEWTDIAPAHKAMILGALGDYYMSLGGSFTGATLNMFSLRVSELRIASDQIARSEDRTSPLLKIHGDETTLENEYHLTLARALNMQGDALQGEGQLEPALNAYLESLEISEGRWNGPFSAATSGLNQLAEEFRNTGSPNQAAWIEEQLGECMVRQGRINGALAYLHVAGSLYSDSGKALLAKYVLDRGLTEASQFQGERNEKFNEYHAKLLWLRDHTNKNLPEIHRLNDDQRLENLRQLAALSRDSEFEGKHEAQLYALMMSAEMMMEDEQLQYAADIPEILTEAGALLHQASESPGVISEERFVFACWTVGLMMIEHSPELAEEAPAVLELGIAAVDEGSETTQRDYFPLLRARAIASAVLNQSPDEGLKDADRALSLYPEPEEHVRATAIASLMEVRSSLLEQLGMFQEATENQEALAEFRERHGLPEFQ